MTTEQDILKQGLSVKPTFGSLSGVSEPHLLSPEERIEELRRLVYTAQQKVEVAQKEVEFFQATLDAYIAAFSPEGAKRRVEAETHLRFFMAATMPQIVRMWADTHDGRIVVRELVAAAFATGRWEGRKKVHRNIWSAIAIAKRRGEFISDSPGIVRYA